MIVNVFRNLILAILLSHSPFRDTRKPSNIQGYEKIGKKCKRNICSWRSLRKQAFPTEFMFSVKSSVRKYYGDCRCK